MAGVFLKRIWGSEYGPDGRRYRVLPRRRFRGLEYRRRFSEKSASSRKWRNRGRYPEAWRRPRPHDPPDAGPRRPDSRRRSCDRPPVAFFPFASLPSRVDLRGSGPGPSRSAPGPGRFAGGRELCCLLHGRRQCAPDAVEQPLRGRQRRISRSAVRANESGPGGRRRRRAARTPRGAGLPVLGPLQVGCYPQAEQRRVHVRGHRMLADRQPGCEGGHPDCGERLAAPSCAAGGRTRAMHTTGG